MGLPYIQRRKPLAGLQQAINIDSVTFGFIGGSITDARPRHNWPQFFIEQFISQFPKVRCRVENAAIGATGSDLAVFRTKRDLIDRQCDVVFIEFAVNDEDVEAVRRFRTREGLIRQLLNAGIQDIVLVYTYSQKMQDNIEKNEYPLSILDFEKLAQYYQLPSIWVGKYGYDQVQQGRLSMEAWLPDGLHPNEEGSRIYAELVHSFICDEINRYIGLSTNIVIPPPIDDLCWEITSTLPFKQIDLQGKWQEYRWHNYEWIDTILETTDINALMSFSFYGRGAVLVFDYGYDSFEFQYRIDEEKWIDSNRDCPEWVGSDGWFRLFELNAQLPLNEHKVEVRINRLLASNSENKHFRIGKVGILL